MTIDMMYVITQQYILNSTSKVYFIIQKTV